MSDLCFPSCSQWSLPGAADYVTNPEDPTGFWPEYLKAVVAKLSEAYGKEIKLIRKYYQNSDLVVDAVKSAEEVEMSEPYYYLSGFYGNVPRIEAFGFSCATAGTASQFYTLKKNNITSLDVLADGIENGNKLMGFIGKVSCPYLSQPALPCQTPSACIFEL